MMNDKKAPQLVPYHFRKGESGNKNGARGYNNRRRAAKEVSTECLSRISEALFDGDLQGLADLANDETVTPIERLCIEVVRRAYDKGDSQALAMLMDRFIGSPIKKVEVTAAATPGERAAELSDEELNKRKRLLEEANK